MKKKMYKAKKRWVVTGVAAAAFLTPSTLAQAEEQVSVPAVVVTETPETTTAPSETQTPVEVLSTSTTDSTSQVADLPVTEAVTSSPEVSESSRVLTPEPKEEARRASRVAALQVDTKLTEEVSKAKTSEAPVTDSTDQKPLTVTQGTESMTLTYTEEIPAESDLQVAVWSQAGDQDDLIWYSLPKGQATVSYNNHWEYGLYHLHAYFRQKATGKMSFVTSETITLTPPKLDTQIKATSETSYEVTISNVPSYFHKLYVPIWSSVHDQDDLIWYEGQKQSDGRYKVSVDIDNHNSSTGLYYLHYYEGKPNGKKVYVGQASYAQPVPKAPTLSVSPRTDRQFEVTISNVPAKYTSVVLPTWTSQKDQDDLKWYRAQKHSDGTYRVTVNLDQHHFETEGYQLHLYGEVGEKKTFLAKASYNHPKTAVETTVVGVKEDQFAVTVRNVPSYIDQIRIPTWSDQNGQDDIRWYIAQKAGDGSYRLTVNIKDHQYASGLYHIHVYGNAGKEENIFLNANKTYNVATPKAETTVESVIATSFKVTVKNVPSYLSTVILPTWSAQRDQDDLKWYQAQKQVDGSYSLTVNIKDHQYDTGVYHIHSYGRTSDGKLIFLDGDKVTVKALPKPTATLAIENVNKEKGTFEVVVSDLKSVGGVSLVQLPTWSEAGGQDDIRWYTATRQADGNYRLTVRASDHKYTSGKYHVHLYVTNDGGKREFVGATETTLTTLPNILGNISVSAVDKSDYTFKTTISNVAARKGVSEVRVAVWTEEKGQDDLVWLNAVKQTNGDYTVLTRLANHSYASGKYHIHVYYTFGDGQSEFLGSKDQTVSGLTSRSAIQKDLNELLSAYRNIFSGMPGKKSVFLSPLDGTELAMIDNGAQRSASTIKLFILAAAHAKATRGELNLSEIYTVKGSDIVEASVSLTGKAGQSYKLSDIASFMIQTSDNTATNIMIDKLGGIKAINDEIRRMGYSETTLNRRMRIPSEINRGLENYISVHEAGDLIKNIINGSLRDINGEGTMKYYLNHNIHNYWLTNQTRSVATVYDKPGNDGRYGVENDVAVITKNGRGYVAVVLTHESGSNGLSYSNLFARFGSIVASKL